MKESITLAKDQALILATISKTNTAAVQNPRRILDPIIVPVVSNRVVIGRLRRSWVIRISIIPEGHGVAILSHPIGRLNCNLRNVIGRFNHKNCQ
ncbi:uncharacterized protein PADG_12243 [Paracoccidioides brasiliensis Pb18]|uniref:Uncharacterized protein n=1 Tax=Paracoccidioides brasiliensis (strain Pb18) TaxID=502780 RepID=A0A0A0HUI1_PARBD|nr:uncharacterized protein PADG_12243 [Paracoccidioides brasiliensis Pb18]KGM91671.1 hypothetical protein PADG_12243 [Paracoccidioides brasiliensis Pb18]